MTKILIVKPLCYYSPIKTIRVTFFLQRRSLNEVSRICYKSEQGTGTNLYLKHTLTSFLFFSDESFLAFYHL